MTESPRNRRILVIDDNPAIHEDMRKILGPDEAGAHRVEGMAEVEAALFGESETEERVETPTFEIDSALQGDEGLKMVRDADAAGRPYAVAFVDMRMPPGWDGVETIEHLWEEFPDIEVVICTAFSDYSLDETHARLGRTDRLLILKKPFDNVEVIQLATALTEKWTLARETNERIDQLRDVVQARTAELESARDELRSMTDRLREVQVRAETVNRSRQALLADVGHEIRTPMTAILGYAQLLQESRLSGRLAPEERLEALDTIGRTTEHLLSVVNDILELSRLETGCVRLDHTAFSPRELVGDVTDLLRAEVQQRRLELVTELDDGVPDLVETDPTRLRQIVLNLASNAVRCTETGRVTIRVRVRNDGQEGVLEIDVEDTGRGMTAAEMERAFDRFETGVSAVRDARGVGLGLPISRELARALGGMLDAASRPGEGSRFTVAVPVGLPATDGRPAGDDDVNGDDDPIDGRILLVEDSRDHAEFLRMTLVGAGAEVVLAGNGYEACSAIGEAQSGASGYDLVLLDVELPRMDGPSAAEQMRDLGYRGPIIALSAHAEPEDRDRCLAAGCDLFLSKPIRPGALLQAVARALLSRPERRCA